MLKKILLFKSFIFLFLIKINAFAEFSDTNIYNIQYDRNNNELEVYVKLSFDETKFQILKLSKKNKKFDQILNELKKAQKYQEKIRLHYDNNFNILNLSLFLDTEIHQIIMPEEDGEDYLILTNINGHVFKVKDTFKNKDLIDLLQKAQINLETVKLYYKKIIIDQKNYNYIITSVTKLHDNLEIDYRYLINRTNLHSNNERFIEPISKITYKYAHSLFYDSKIMKVNSRFFSQCYRRAHWWSFALYRKRNIVTGKVFLFFSRKYIKKYNFQWWFHTAPYLIATKNGEEAEYVMDRTNFTSPVKLYPDWIEYFMRYKPTKTECTFINNYKEYYDNNTDWCFIRKTSMFHFQPADVESVDRDLEQKRTWWLKQEVKKARRDFKDFWITPFKKFFNPDDTFDYSDLL